LEVQALVHDVSWESGNQADEVSWAMGVYLENRYLQIPSLLSLGDRTSRVVKCSQIVRDKARPNSP